MRVSDSIVVSVFSGTMHVADGNNMPLRGDDTVNMVFQNNFQDYTWISMMKNSGYQFIVDYPMDGEGLYNETVEVNMSNELKVLITNTLINIGISLQ